MQPLPPAPRRGARRPRMHKRASTDGFGQLHGGLGRPIIDILHGQLTMWHMFAYRNRSGRALDRRGYLQLTVHDFSGMISDQYIRVLVALYVRAARRGIQPPGAQYSHIILGARPAGGPVDVQRARPYASAVYA